MKSQKHTFKTAIPLSNETAINIHVPKLWFGKGIWQTEGEKGRQSNHVSFVIFGSLKIGSAWILFILFQIAAAGGVPAVGDFVVGKLPEVQELNSWRREVIKEPPMSSFASRYLNAAGMTEGHSHHLCRATLSLEPDSYCSITD